MENRIVKFGFKQVIVIITLSILLFVAWNKFLDKKAYKSNLETTKDVAVYLASARGINAILTVFENTTVSVGMGATIELSIGKIVNPINDFLDRFSWIMLVSLISLGMQKLILTLGEANIINVLLSISAFTVIFSQIYANTNKMFYEVSHKILLFMIFIRFAIPSAEYINSYIYDKVMYNQIQVAQSKMNNMEKSLEKITATIKENPIEKKIEDLESDIEQLGIDKQHVIDGYFRKLKNSKSKKEETSYFDKFNATIQDIGTTVVNEAKKITESDYDIYPSYIRKKLHNLDKVIETKKIEIDRLDTSLINTFKESLKLKLKKIDTITDIYFEQTYTLIVLFLFRAIFFPILYIWLLLKMIDSLFRFDYSSRLEQIYIEKVAK